MRGYCWHELYWHRWGRTHLHIRFDRRVWCVGFAWERGISQAGDEFEFVLRPLPMIAVTVRRLYGWPEDVNEGVED
jgi:hypothetical protein